MRMPEKPPPLNTLMAELDSTKFPQLIEATQRTQTKELYPHWDKLRFWPPPEGLTHREWWLGLKLSRIMTLKPVSLRDSDGAHFKFAVPEPVAREIHKIDLGAGGMVSMPEQITNPQTRDRYLVSSLVEEAITSSQLEGAATTRDVAKRMIASGREPRDEGERMILNNYITMQRIRELKREELSPKLVLEIHRLVTDKTFDDPTAAGRFRRSDEKRIGGNEHGDVFHEPPPAEQLAERMEEMCAFANGSLSGEVFVHPVVRAIILHFWLAYDHPFLDGNGRTARTLFYWSMLKSGYWLFEFISISNILRKAPAKYGRSFLHTETDDNDLTYFLLAQTRVISRAISSLHAYINRKTAEIKEVQAHTRALDLFNHRQVALLSHALKHPEEVYQISGHQQMHKVAYQTARTDLLGLAEQGALLQRKGRSKKALFTVPNDLSERLLGLSSKSSGP